MDVDTIFDAVGKWSEHVHRIDARNKELARLRENSTRKCGNCYWWMKSRDCPIDNQRNGFPSCNHSPCGKFQATTDAIEWQRQYNALLASAPTSSGESK